jgi:cytochrome P450
MTVSFDPLSAEDWQNPYPVYRQLRDEAPVHYAPTTGVWCVSRHADVVEVLKNHEDFQSSKAFELLIEGRFKTFGVLDAFELVRFLVRGRINPLTMRRNPPQSLITSDPPRHDFLRSIVNRGFTPRRIQSGHRQNKLRPSTADK